MDRSLWRRDVMPFAARMLLLLASAALADAALHWLGLEWVGRFLGVPGTLLILLSFVYTLRKRKLIAGGEPAKLLRLHERLAWLGAFTILVHAGVRVNAVLPWLALAAMLVNVVSGLVGQSLLDASRRSMIARRESLAREGLSPEAVEREVFWDAVAVDAMKHWRAVHIPITLAFAGLSLGHIASVVLLWNRR